ncbi:MAG: ribosome biogenesis GTP-binding protein YihA/YsxC [Desulfonatronovibrionaceae bacterium]
MSRLTLETTAYTHSQLLWTAEPQIALAGRSNSGKSSLINCLGGNRRLARISSTPGKTRSINYYRVEPDGFYLVDLPGYGYARCSKEEQARWQALIQSYLEGNPGPRALVLLLDARLQPQTADLELAHYAGSLALPLIPVLTKADKCRQKELSRAVSSWTSILGLSNPPVIFSARTGQGKDQLLHQILQAVS